MVRDSSTNGGIADVKQNTQLRHILLRTRPRWDRDETRPSVRSAFTKAVLCRTPSLGAEIFASKTEEYAVYHTCKSRPCSSCGYRSTVQWQRERWAALPNVPYKGITFTMPDVLWPFFRDNPDLTHALPALAATIIQSYAGLRFGLQVGVIAILHTFNGKLEFNSHVHTMVSAGGLGGAARWNPGIYYDDIRLMENWRKAVVKLLRSAVKVNQLISALSPAQVEASLVQQETRWWSLKIQSFKTKEHFLKYAGRYLRRPPIAQRRITHVQEDAIQFWYKDKKVGRKVAVRCSPEEFVDRWSKHIPERYCHAVRNFGLFSPRSVAQDLDAVFGLVGQTRMPRPQPRRWAESIRRDFGRDPLMDSKGERMTWSRRLAPAWP